MTKIIILHPVRKGRFQDTAETDKFIDVLRQRYQVIDLECEKPHDYTRGMARIWGQDDLIVIEHDVVPTLADIAELITCQGPFCTYPVAFPTHREQTFRDWVIGKWTSLSCTKIDLWAQATIKKEEIKPNWPWWNLDGQLCRLLFTRAGLWHVHNTLVKHNHKIGGKLGVFKWEP